MGISDVTHQNGAMTMELTIELVRSGIAGERLGRCLAALVLEMERESSSVNHMRLHAMMKANSTMLGSNGRKSTWEPSVHAHAMEDSRVGAVITAEGQDLLLLQMPLDTQSPSTHSDFTQTIM